MGIEEIKGVYNTDCLMSNGPALHKVWKLDFLDNSFFIERYGSPCGWDHILIKKNGSEVYRINLIKRNDKDKSFGFGNEKREEFFFEMPTRAYLGDRFSFIEYIEVIANRGKIPSRKTYIQYGLDEDTENIYRKNLHKILRSYSYDFG